MNVCVDCNLHTSSLVDLAKFGRWPFVNDHLISTNAFFADL